MEDGSRSYRDLASALPAMKVAPACRPGFCTNATASTLETMWPTASKKIASASRFIGEPFQKLLIRARVVFSRYRNRAGAHAQSYYMQRVLASSGYPPFFKNTSTSDKKYSMLVCVLKLKIKNFADMPNWKISLSSFISSNEYFDVISELLFLHSKPRSVNFFDDEVKIKLSIIPDILLTTE
jgi:hypothetical protein